MGAKASNLVDAAAGTELWGQQYRYQAPPRQDLDREEARSREHIHVPPDELLPSRHLTPLGSWCDVVAAQNVAHGLIRNVMTQVGQRADNAFVPSE
jgi:hypothetical protein